MTTVKKAKTAFMYFQADTLSSIRSSMDGASMGDAMQELARRWKALTAEERAPYLQRQEEDQQRFQQESASADQAAWEALQNKRAEAENVSGARGARALVDEERAIREAKRKSRQEAAQKDDSEEAVRRREEKAAKRAAAEERRKERQEQEDAMKKQHTKLDKVDAKKAQSRLEYLFAQSDIFAKLHGGKGALPEGDEEDTKPAAKAVKNKDKDHRAKADENIEEEEDGGERHIFLTKQPSVIKGGQLKPYQLEALNWMIHLSEKGLNGILADEMGLGKTVQSIAILAYFYEFMNCQGPHLICVPKSTMSNWMNELKRWCPSLRVLKFHGQREEREHMTDTMFSNEAAAHDGKRPSAQIMGHGGEMIDDNSMNPRSWDVCVTTYEIANMEKRSLQKFAWKYLIIDEAHRLKNEVSMFSTTVRSFRTANRLLLTGTPLQNNLHELWALLNFLLPSIFSSSEQFDEWFDLEIDDEEAKKNIIQQLHKILRPFMLRRLKADVAKGLPPKTETILMVGMSKVQKQLYKQLLLRDIDSISGKGSRTAVLNIVMQLRKCCGHPYLFEGVEDRTLDPLGEHLVENCGKLSLMDKLLKRLKERDSRVLIFTQMTRVLDILEDFMHMRGYKYCRIDGNTTYDDREDSIAAFNAPNSEKFCFILSTRAGGLGINLQTADVCVLYDSDWNPQADLQAQDRCHRLGQKKPVSVFRLVTEHTIEEKIVERAQQKLKLDAMVVQQGRLKDKDKVSKEEILAAVRFGADTIFRSDESTITDEDIDVILERGKAKTLELTEKIQKAEKGDLLDFRLDGGVSAQTFEGVDYSDKGLRDHLRMLAAESVGKRERRPPPTDYNPIIISKKSMVVNNHRIKLPKPLRVPQMEDHHFYNRERLLELGKLEFQNYAALREANNVPPKEVMEKQRSLLPPELAQEKRELLAEGFGHWSRSQYFHFVKACATFGRANFTSIANDMDMPVEEVTAYSQSFWRYGATELKDEWERVITSIDRGEKKLEKQQKQSDLLTKFVATFPNPREDMVFANKGTVHFALEQDRAILCAVEKHGYGNWEAVKEELRSDHRLLFQHSVQGMSIQAIIKRCDYRMRQMEKEVEARERIRKNRRPQAVVAAQLAMESMKQMDEWEALALDALLSGRDPPPMSMSADARATLREQLEERNAAILRLREIEVQYRHALQIADNTRESIFNGAQYVNYSNINMKAAGTVDSNIGSIQDDVKLEAAINARVLKIPECGGCARCVTGKLCENRLVVRERMIAEAKKIEEKKKGKKRPKTEPAAASASTKDKGKPVTGPDSGPAKKKQKKTGPETPTPSVATSSSSVASIRPGRAHQGNRKMVVPEELIPELCRRISANGCFERAAVINRFIEDYPSVSQRQISFKFSELTTKEKPACVPLQKPLTKKTGRVFMAYLRPRYYKMLPASERPADWARYAADDEVLYQKELLEEKAKKKAAPASAKDSPGGGGGDDVSTSGGGGGGGGGNNSKEEIVEAAVAVEEDDDDDDDVMVVAAEVVADDGADDDDDDDDGMDD